MQISGSLHDDKLRQKDDITNVCKKTSIRTTILIKAKYILNTNSSCALYCALILTYLTHCVEVWGNNYEKLNVSLFAKKGNW